MKQDAAGHTIDNQGRVCYGGRPLRNKEEGKAAFHGEPGKPHPKAAQLKVRQAAFDAAKGKNEGFKRPGSIRARSGR